LPLKAEFPAGASAKRAAIPAPNRSVLPKTMVQREGGQDINRLLTNPQLWAILIMIIKINF
jgi:hypothetical protein